MPHFDGPRAALVIGQNHGLMRPVPYLLKRAGFDVDIISSSPFTRKTSNTREIKYVEKISDFLLHCTLEYLSNYLIIAIGDDQTLREVLNSTITEEMKLKLLPVNSEFQYSHIYSKIGLANALTRASLIKAPDYRVAANFSDILKISKEFENFIIIKIDASGGGEGVIECKYAEDLINAMKINLPFPILVQRLIEGTVIDLSGIFINGKLIHFTHSKFDACANRKFGPSSVRTYTQISETHPEIISELKELGEILGINGFATISCLESKLDGQRYYFEADLRPNVWSDYGKYVGNDPAVALKNYLKQTNSSYSIDLSRNSKFPLSLTLPYPTRLSPIELITNKYHVWKYINVISRQEITYRLINNILFLINKFIPWH